MNPSNSDSDYDSYYEEESDISINEPDVIEIVPDDDSDDDIRVSKNFNRSNLKLHQARAPLDPSKKRTF